MSRTQAQGKLGTAAPGVLAMQQPIATGVPALEAGNKCGSLLQNTGNDYGFEGVRPVSEPGRRSMTSRHLKAFAGNSCPLTTALPPLWPDREFELVHSLLQGPPGQEEDPQNLRA